VLAIADQLASGSLLNPAFRAFGSLLAHSQEL
jgi:hypothetical protein